MSRIAMQFRPSAWKVFKLVWHRQCKLLGVKYRDLVQVTTFFIIVISLFHISIGPAQLQTTISAGVLYSSWMFALILPLGTMLESDYRRGFLQQFYLTGVSLEWVLLAQYLGNLVVYCALSLITIPIALLLLHIDYALWPLFIIGGLLMTASITLSLLLCYILVIGSNTHTLLGIIALPSLLPFIIFCTLGVQQPAYLMIMLLIWVGMVPICLMAGSYALLAAFEDS